MAVNSHELARTVKSLQASAHCEADWRAVCSRAYYSIYQDGAAFHDSLKSPGALVTSGKGGMHANLHERLKNPTLKHDDPLHKVSKQVGYLMAVLHVARVKSDYYRDQDVSAHDADTSAANADAVVAFITTGALPAVQSSPAGAPVSAVSFQPACSHRPTLTRIK